MSRMYLNMSDLSWAFCYAEALCHVHYVGWSALICQGKTLTCGDAESTVCNSPCDLSWPNSVADFKKAHRLIGDASRCQLQDVGKEQRYGPTNYGKKLIIIGIEVKSYRGHINATHCLIKIHPCAKYGLPTSKNKEVMAQPGMNLHLTAIPIYIPPPPQLIKFQIGGSWNARCWAIAHCPNSTGVALGWLVMNMSQN